MSRVTRNGARAKISVCVPTYNGAAYLRQCLDSIRAQSFGDFEVVIVDDCSSDDTLAIAREYVASDARFRVERNPANLGLVGNWNRCIDIARGEWIKFVFQDDFIDPRCLELLVAQADGALLVFGKRSLEIAAGVSDSVRDWYAVTHRAILDEVFAQGPSLTARRCQELALARLGINVFGEPTSALIHVDAFARFGRFEPCLISACDLEYWIRVSSNVGARLVPIDLATFRVHGDAASARNHEQRHYRMRLERVLLFRHYLREPAYRGLRQTARQLGSLAALRRTFDERRHLAKALARWAGQRGDVTLRDEWQTVCRAYPDIDPGIVRHGAWRLRQRLAGALRDKAVARGAEPGGSDHG